MDCERIVSKKGPYLQFEIENLKLKTICRLRGVDQNNYCAIYTKLFFDQRVVRVVHDTNEPMQPNQYNFLQNIIRNNSPESDKNFKFEMNFQKQNRESILSYFF